MQGLVILTLIQGHTHSAVLWENKHLSANYLTDLLETWMRDLCTCDFVETSLTLACSQQNICCSYSSGCLMYIWSFVISRCHHVMSFNADMVCCSPPKADKHHSTAVVSGAVTKVGFSFSLSLSLFVSVLLSLSVSSFGGRFWHVLVCLSAGRQHQIHRPSWQNFDVYGDTKQVVLKGSYKITAFMLCSKWCCWWCYHYNCCEFELCVMHVCRVIRTFHPRLWGLTMTNHSQLMRSTEGVRLLRTSTSLDKLFSFCVPLQCVPAVSADMLFKQVIKRCVLSDAKCTEVLCKLQFVFSLCVSSCKGKVSL